MIGALFLIASSITITYFQMVNPDISNDIEANLNNGLYFAVFVQGIISMCYVSQYFKESSFGVEVKRIIKVRHYVNLIGWLTFNVFVYVSA